MSVERAIIRGQRQGGEPECCPEELAAWVEHGADGRLGRVAMGRQFGERLPV